MGSIVLQESVRQYLVRYKKQNFRNEYEVIVYRGDSAPDYKASLHADIRFVKGELSDLYEKNGVEHMPISSFEEVLRYFKKS